MVTVEDVVAMEARATMRYLKVMASILYLVVMPALGWVVGVSIAEAL